MKHLQALYILLTIAGLFYILTGCGKDTEHHRIYVEESPVSSSPAPEALPPVIIVNVQQQQAQVQQAPVITAQPPAVTPLPTAPPVPTVSPVPTATPVPTKVPTPTATPSPLPTCKPSPKPTPKACPPPKCYKKHEHKKGGCK